MPNPYQIVPLPSDLSPYIESIFIEPLFPSVSSQPFIVWPGLSTVLGFQYRGHLNHISEGRNKILHISGVSGIQTRYQIFRAEPETRTIIIKFHPGQAMKFLHTPMHLITNHAVSLDNFIARSMLDSLEDQLASANDYHYFADLLINFLRSLLSKSQIKHGTLKLHSVITHLQFEAAQNRVENIIQSSSYSERTLERHFKEFVGLSPKKFLGLIRFQQAMSLLSQGFSDLQIIGKLNYYDQAHFINDFKTYTGLTPSQWILSDFSNILPSSS